MFNKWSQKEFAVQPSEFRVLTFNIDCTRVGSQHCICRYVVFLRDLLASWVPSIPMHLGISILLRMQCLIQCSKADKFVTIKYINTWICPLTSGIYKVDNVRVSTNQVFIKHHNYNISNNIYLQINDEWMIDFRQYAFFVHNMIDLF